MRLHLKELMDERQKKVVVEIQDRLPDFISSPCKVAISYQIKAVDDYFVLNLTTEANLGIICQRCLEEGVVPYENALQLAVCSSEGRAEELMADYECVVSSDLIVDLREIVTDELYLYAPQFHLDKDCRKFSSN